MILSAVFLLPNLAPMNARRPLVITIGALLPAFFALLPTATRADWTVQYGNASSNVGISVATDSAGHVFTGGYTDSGLNGQSSLGGTDGYVAKYDSSGTVQWTNLFGTASADYVFGVTTVGSGVAAAGYTGSGLPGQSYAGGQDAMVRLYDSSGATLWTRQWGTAGIENARSVAADGAGHLYIGGYTSGSFSGYTNAGGNDLFVTQLYAATGAVNWTFQLGTTGSDQGMGVAADSAGNVYLGGYTTGALPGQTSAGGSDAFVLKLDVTGTLQWTQQFGSSGSDAVRGIAVDSTGAVLTAGYTAGTLIGQTSAGSFDAFAQKRDASGNVVWTSQFGTAVNDLAHGVAVDSANQVVVGGYTDGAFPGEVDAGAADALVRVLSPAGTEVFTDQIGSTGNDTASGVATDTFGHAYLAGNAGGALPGQTSAGSVDGFLIQTAVPEPTTAALLALGLLALPRRRRAR